MSALVKPLTWILGVVLLLVGVLGFFMPSPLLGLFEVDTVHNIVHILSGVVALWAGSTGYQYSRMYLMVFGLVYLLVALLGFFMSGSILGLFSVNMYDNYLHTAIGVVCLLTAFASHKTA
jgi:hypothetical protein